MSQNVVLLVRMLGVPAVQAVLYGLIAYYGSITRSQNLSASSRAL